MESEHFHPERVSSFDGLRHRVRNVVQLQIEKNFSGWANQRRSIRGIILEPDLEESDGAGKCTDERQPFLRRRNIQRDNNLLGGWRLHSVIRPEFVARSRYAAFGAREDQSFLRDQGAARRWSSRNRNADGSDLAGGSDDD